MATYKPYRKTTNGKEEIKIPYSVLSNPPTIPTKASDVNALSLDGGTINKSKTIKMDASANSDGANLKWGTVNSKNPYIGYASDQVDGTFVVGSLLGTNYASGLAIGGGSGNLLWKGTKVATTSDIPTDYVKYTAQTLTDAQKSQARSNIGAGTSNFDGTWGSLSGKPNVVQSTGNSTSDVMSQNAVTNELNKKANSADLAQVATSGSYNDLVDKPTIPNTAKHSSKQLETNTDLNTLNSAADIGWYHVGGGNKCAHKPTGVDAFGLEVGRSAGGWFYQVLTSSNASTSRGRRFMRTYSGTAWDGWMKVAITSEIPTFSLSGTTLTITTN